MNPSTESMLRKALERALKEGGKRTQHDDELERWCSCWRCQANRALKYKWQPYVQQE